MPTWRDVFNPEYSPETEDPVLQQRTTPPTPETPEPALWERALQKLSALSQLDQAYSAGALEQRGDWLGTAARRSGIPQAAGMIGRAIGAPFAALGATLTTGPMGYPTIRTDSADKMQAFKEGLEGGAAGAKELVTPLNVAGVVTAPAGVAGRLLGAADVALGAGDIYRAAQEKDPMAAAMGAVRVGMGGAFAAGLGAGPKSPKLAADTAAAMKPRPGAEPFFQSAETTPPNVQVTPQAQKAVEFLGNQVLRAVNESAAKGFQGQFPGEAPLLPVSQVVVDPTFRGLAKVDQKIPDTIVLGELGVQHVLSGATDARGVTDNLLSVISHEVQHPTEFGIGAQRVGKDLGPGGHASGGIDDDRLMAFTQQFREHGIREAAKNHPYLSDAATVVERTGALKDAFLPARVFGADVVSQPVRDLQLFHEVMGTPKEQLPVVPAHKMEAARPELPLDLFQDRTSLKMGDDLFDKRPKLRALTGRQLPLPGAAVTDIAELPATKKLIDLLRAPREERARLKGVGLPNSVDVLNELHRAVVEGRIQSAGHLKSLGVERGDLWPVYNNIDKAIRKLGVESKGGKELLTKLRYLAGERGKGGKLPRAFGAAPRDLGVNPRMGGTTITPGSLRAIPKGADLTPEGAAVKARAEAMQARRDVINAGNKVAELPKGKGDTLPEVTERLGTLGAALERLKGFFGRLGPKGRKPGVERLPQAERRTKSEEFAARRAERERLKAEAAAKPEDLQMGAGLFRDKEKFGKNLGPKPKRVRNVGKRLEAILAGKVAPKAPQFRMLREEAAAQPKSFKERLAGFKESLKAKPTKFSGKLPSGEMAEFTPETIQMARRDPELLAQLREELLQRRAKVGETGQLPSRGEKKLTPKPGPEGPSEVLPIHTAEQRAKIKKMEAQRTYKKTVGPRYDFPNERPQSGSPATFHTTKEQAAGAKKVPPTTYHFKAKKGFSIEQVMEPLRRKLFGAEPLKSVASSVRADRDAIARLRDHMNRGTQVVPELIDVVGFTPEMKSRVKLALAKATKGNRPLLPSERVSRFETQLRIFESELLQRGVGEKARTGRLPEGATPKEGRDVLLRQLAEQGSKAPLIKDAAKKLPEGKLSPFNIQKGAAIPRKEAFKRNIIWKDAEGNTVTEGIKSKEAVVRGIKERLGVDILPEDVVPAAISRGEGRATSPIKAYSERATLKDLLEKAKKAGDTELVSKIEAAPEYIEVVGKQPAEMEFGALPAETVKGKARFEKIPDTLNPFSSPVAPKGGRAGKKNLLKQEEGFAKGKGGVKTDQAFDIAEHYGEKYTGPRAGVVSERMVAKPRKLREVKAPVTPESIKAKAAYVRDQVKLGMEELGIFIHKLGAGGRLRNVAEAREMAKQKYDYRNLLEDYLDGRPIDLDDEYMLNRGELKSFEQKLKRKYEGEWDQLQVEAGEERLAFRSAERLKERYEGRQKATDISLPTETKDWLKKQTTPRLFSEQQAWVKRQVAAGNLKPTEAEDALEFLRRREQAFERHVSRPVSPTQRMEYLKKGKAKVDLDDLLERQALKDEASATADTGPNPWDLQMGRDLFLEEQVMPLAKKVGKIRESGMQTTRDKIFDNLGEAANFTRPLVTAVDVSNPFRQTYQLTTDQITQDLLWAATLGRYGKQSDTSFGRNIWDMLRSFGSEQKAAELMGALKDDSWFRLADEMGVNFIHKGKVHESWVGHELVDKAFKKFEDKATSLLGKVGAPAKLPRALINASKNSFEYYQNKAMRDAFKHGFDTFVALNKLNPKVYKVRPEDLASLAEYVNNAASRGAVTRNAKWDKRLNYVFYSAQMNASRVRMMGDALFHVTQGVHGRGSSTMSRYARRQMMRAITGAVAANGLIYSIAAATGEKPEVEDSLISTDFGKIKVGDITYDGGGGWYQFVRASAQVLTGKEKERGTGIERPKNVGDTVVNFFRSKLGPGASAVANVLTERTVEGAPVDFKRNPSGAASTLISQLVTPMSVEDMNDIVQENPRVSWLIPLMLLGNSVGENTGRGVRAWRTTEPLKMAERVNRAELKARGVYQPTLSTRVTIPGRDTAGRPNYYTLSPAEREEFEKEYMPLVTQLLNEFITSEAYQRVADHKKRAVLYKKVHQLNTLYGANAKLRKKYAEKAKRGEVKPSNLEPEKD